MKKLSVFISLLLIALVAYADTCPRCHGQRRVKTRHAVSSYGLSSERITCPNCGERISPYDNHYDDCPLCGGSGQTSSRTASSYTSHSSSSSSTSADPFVTYLSVAEYNNYMDLVRAYAKGVYKTEKCEACRGTGICQTCGGAGYSSPPTLYSPMIPCMNFNCNAGYCRVCKGTGSTSHYSREEADLKPIAQQLTQYFNLVWQRQQSQYKQDQQFAKEMADAERKELERLEEARRDSIRQAEIQEQERERERERERKRLQDSIANSKKSARKEPAVNNEDAVHNGQNVYDGNSQGEEGSNVPIIIAIIIGLCCVLLLVLFGDKKNKK